MNQLSKLKCTPCTANTPRLGTGQIASKLHEIDGWQLVRKDSVDTIERAFSFYNFRQALNFTVELGELAESENHHPAILTEWGKVKVSWWTHSIKGLHNNDFIMAAITDKLFNKLQSSANEPLKK